jgi:Lysylphosphatidylglycerol synthase TM region
VRNASGVSTICTPALPARRAISFGPWARAGLGAAALAAGAVVVGRRIDFTALGAAQIAWPWIAASLLLNLASVLGKAVVWKITLEALPEGRRTRYAHVVPALFIGFLLNTVLFARVGEVARVAVLARRTRLAGRPVPARAVAGTVIAEQLLVGVGLAIAVLGLVVTCDLPAIATRLLFALIAIVALAGVLIHLLARSSRGRVRAIIEGVVEGNAVLRRPGAATAAIAAGTVSWFAQIGAALVFVATTIVQLFPFWPGNVGMFQLGVYAPLVQLCAVPGSTAIAFGVGLQVVEALLGVGLGLVFLAREGLTFGGARLLASDEVRLAVPRTGAAPATMSL